MTTKTTTSNTKGEGEQSSPLQTPHQRLFDALSRFVEIETMNETGCLCGDIYDTANGEQCPLCEGQEALRLAESPATLKSVCGGPAATVHPAESFHPAMPKAEATFYDEVHPITKADEAAMAGHTPGPWRMSPPSQPDNTGGRDRAILDTRNKIIAEAFEHVGWNDKKAGIYEKRPAQANARLIAASPDLLEACELLIKSHGLHGPCVKNACPECDKAYRAGRAAITKATK